MYIVLMILRELRRLFHDKSVKRFFTIIILGFAIYLLFCFFGVLPDKVAFAAEEITSPYYFDGVAATYRDYEALQNDFVVRVLRDVRDTGLVAQNVRNVLEKLTNGGFITLFYYGDALGTYYQNTFPSASQKNIIDVIQMDASQVTSNTNNFDWGLNGVQSVRGYLCATAYYEFIFNRTARTAQVLNANTARHYMPTYLVDYKSSNLTLLCEEYLSGTLINNASDILTAIENQTDKIEEQTEVIQETQNTINDSNVDNTIVDSLPESNINDVTADGLNTIFSDVMDALVNPIVENIRVKVPFTNKYFEISSELVYGSNNSYVPEWIRTVVSMFWYYILSVYIVKDIAKIIDNLKNGRFEGVASTNIKEDML